MKRPLLRIAVEHRGTLVTGVGLQTVQSYVGMATIVFFQRIIDSLRGGSPIGFASTFAVYIALTAANHLLIYLQDYPQRVFRVGTYLSVKRRAMRKLAVIDYGSYTKLDTGTTVQIVENGATSGSSMLSDFWLFLIVTALTLPVQLYLIQMYDFVLFLVILGGYAVLFAVAQLLMRLSETTMRKIVSRKEELSNRFTRGFMALVSFRIQRRFAREVERVDELSTEVAKSEGRIRLVNELFFTGFALLVFAVEAVVIVRQASLIEAGRSSVGTLVALVTFVRSVFGPVSGFSFAFVNYKMNRIPWRRFLEYLSLPSDAYLSGAGGVRPSRGELALRSVDFSYADRPILEGVSVSIASGTRTAIVGSSGAGKSTMIRLLLGLLKPRSGLVTVGGVDLSEIDLEAYYRKVSLVSQEAPIFDGTLAENLGDGGLAEDRLEKVLEAASLTEFVGNLPDGIHTRLGERGISVSAGEGQRVALARVLLDEAAYILLDEPTSALDSETEAKVMRSFFEMTSGRTIVLVAHRLQPIRFCDQIIVMDRGRVIERGGFAELIERNGSFRRLWDEQTRS